MRLAQIFEVLFAAVACLVLLLVPARAQTPATPTTSHPAAAALMNDPKRAQKDIEAGDKAAADGRFDDALAAYDEAARNAPQNIAVLGKGAALRAQLVRAHTDNAEQFALHGDVAKAIDEFRTAMRIDPANAVVAERMAQIAAMRDDEPAGARATIRGLPRLNIQPGKHNLDLHSDTRSAYDLVTHMFGIKAAFDPDLPSRRVHLRVDDVDFTTAIALLAQTSGTFWRPVDANLIFVTADTPEKRRQFAVQAEQTFPLSASVAPEEMTELLRVLREITASTRVELDTNSHSITMRDTPEKLELASELIDQVERARGEVMLEIELLEVDKDKATQLGITPPASGQAFLISPNDIRALSQASDVTNALTILGQLFSAQGITSIPGFTLVGGGYSTFLLTLPSTAANFSDALTLVQSGRQVLLRAQDGKPATFFVGDRYPITLSLLSGSLGTGTGTSTTNGSVPVIGALPSSSEFPETTFNVGNNPVALAAAAYSGGTLPDLAVVNQNDNTISILLNQDNGNFVAQANSPIKLGANELGPVAIATGTFGNTVVDSSGVTVAPVDLVIANATTNNVTVLLGNNDGTFSEAPGSPYAVGTNPSSVVVADLNGDGNLDFAVTNKGDNSVSFFKGDGTGKFTAFPASPFTLQNKSTISEKAPVALATANFKNTTLPNSTAPEVDLAIVNENSNNVAILLGSLDTASNVTFTEATSSPIAVGNTPVAIAASDLNTDGIPDLAVVNQADNTVSVILGSTNADATFSFAPGSPLSTATTPAGIVIANFTGGEVPSLAVTNAGVSTLGVYVGLGGAEFAPRLEVATPATPSAIISATLTSTGLPDVALTALGPTADQGVVTIFQDSSSFATGSTPTQTPYPGSEYVDLGVKVKATPTLHQNHEVTLQLEFEIRALSGNNINGIPIISNRTLSQVVRVRDDETTLVSGLLDKEETRSLTGLPGLADVPGASYAGSTHNNTSTDTEFMILVTPHRLRSRVNRARSILAGRGDPQSRGSIGAGAPPEPEPEPVTPQPQPDQQQQQRPVPPPQPQPPQP
ncbi:MAG TPA: FG-GAP-like repeat-containing protein [Candidatus Sulfotelmatobacter sp.]|nr:FG-GAP-like repeat-containing protein [Candidatus Sulfotelmatobacter sp.]